MNVHALGSSHIPSLRRGWVIAVMSVLALGPASLLRAQSQPQKSANAAPTAKASSPPAQTSAPSRDKGLATGIQVHGHWTIEVKNPDGAVVTHREFENSLITGNTSGASLLGALLGRVASPGSWVVLLANGPNGLGGVIYITESSSTATNYCNSEQILLSGMGIPVSCAHNLSLTAPAFGASGLNSGDLTGQTLGLSGSGVVPPSFGGNGPGVSFVTTLNLICLASDTPAGCTSDSSFLPLFFSQRNLDGLNGDPPAVSASPGQTVAVTVTYSFQ